MNIESPHRLTKFLVAISLYICLCASTHANATVDVSFNSAERSVEVTLTSSVSLIACNDRSSSSSVFAIFNSRHIQFPTRCDEAPLRCNIMFPEEMFVREVALYCINTNENEVTFLYRGGVSDLPSTSSPLSTTTTMAQALNGSAAIGAFYSGWHAYAAQTVLNQSSPNTPITVEAVIRSNSSLRIEDIYQSLTPSDAAGFYYHSQPSAGFYCIYRKRENETVGVLPDCQNISGITRHHADLLVAAGVNYVTLDSTNLASYSPFADVIQLRPAEVLCEEWFNLRQSGISTPDVTVWAAIPAGANLYSYFLDGIYNNPNLSSVVARDPSSNKMIFFVVENPTMPADPNIVAEIESNSGRNNIVCVKMWALFSYANYSNGEWGFMSPCRDSLGTYTTTVVGSPCHQDYTSNSPLGNAISVSPSYQLNYGSVPFGAPGKLIHETFRLQWNTAIHHVPELQHIFLSSFNEFIAQPQSNPFPKPFGVSMGLSWDPAKVDLWVDTFGCGIARDIEPSVECGNVTYEMMLSCVRSLTLRERFPSMVIVGEICESGGPQAFINVWSLIRTDGSDFLITVAANEVVALLASGQWIEICNAYSGPTSFCVDSGVLTTSLAPTGPFLMVNQSIAGGFGLYRCRTASGSHFFTNDPKCEGQILDMFLGFTSPQRSSNFPRSLLRCYNRTTGVHYHTLDFSCDALDVEEASYGFVH